MGNLRMEALKNNKKILEKREQKMAGEAGAFLQSCLDRENHFRTEYLTLEPCEGLGGWVDCKIKSMVSHGQVMDIVTLASPLSCDTWLPDDDFAKACSMLLKQYEQPTEFTMKNFVFSKYMAMLSFHIDLV